MFPINWFVCYAQRVNNSLSIFYSINIYTNTIFAAHGVMEDKGLNNLNLKNRINLHMVNNSPFSLDYQLQGVILLIPPI